MHVAAYSKAIVALLGSLAVSYGIHVDEAVWAQVGTLITAALVYLIPNAREQGR